jgi:collagen type VII alpha
MRLIGRVTHGAALMLVACVCLPIAASAGEWTVTSSISETVDANSNSNVQLESKSPGGSVGSTTGLSLQAIDETPTLHWETDAILGFSGFWGPGAVGSNLDGVTGTATTAIATSTELTSYNASFSASGLPASFTELFDSGITNTNTKTVSYSGAGGLTHQLNELNTIGLSVSASSEFFTGDNGSPSSASSASATKNTLTPYTYLTTGQSWIHTVTPLTSLTVAASTAWYGTGGVAGTDSSSQSVAEQVSESVTAGVQTQLSERLSFTAGGGGYVVFTTGQSGSTFPGGSSDSTSTGFIANAALSYALQNNTSVSAFASHDLAPSSLGELQEATSAGLTVAHQINKESSIGLSGVFLDQFPTTSIQVDSNQTEPSLVFSLGYQRSLSQYSQCWASIGVDSTQTQRQGGFSLGYQRSLSRNWDLSLVYSFTEQDNGETGFLQPFNDQGLSNSNAVFLTVRYNFNPFGTPKSPNAFGSPTSPGLFGSTASRGLLGSTASPGLFGSTASPGSLGSTASPGLFGSTASPGLLGSTASPGLFGSTASPEPGGGSS